MEYRSLGGTGLQVSTHCLGAMMFGPWGNDRRRRRRPHHPRGARRGHQLRGHRRRLLAGRVRGDRRQGAEGTARRGRSSPRRSTARWGPGCNERGQLPRCGSCARSSDSLPPARDRPHRPVSDPPPRAPDRRRGDARRAHRPPARRARSATSARPPIPGWQMVEAQWAAERRGLSRFRTEQPPYSIFVRHIELDVLPVAERYGMGVLVWSPLCRGWLIGPVPARSDSTGRPSRARRAAPNGRTGSRAQFDESRPEIQRKLDLVEALAKIAADAGMPMPHMAIAFTLAHPAVTSAIIGPRTMEQLEDLVGGSGRAAGRGHAGCDRRARAPGHRRRRGRPRLRPVVARALGETPLTGSHGR